MQKPGVVAESGPVGRCLRRCCLHILIEGALEGVAGTVLQVLELEDDCLTLLYLGLARPTTKVFLYSLLTIILLLMSLDVIDIASIVIIGRFLRGLGDDVFFTIFIFSFLVHHFLAILAIFVVLVVLVREWGRLL